jgi:hypothetical protein
LGKILVMLDKDGDENYQPMVIPLTGGFSEPAFGGQLADDRVHLQECDAANHIVYFNAEARHETLGKAYRGHLTTGQLELLGAESVGPRLRCRQR